MCFHLCLSEFAVVVYNWLHRPLVGFRVLTCLVPKLENTWNVACCVHAYQRLVWVDMGLRQAIYRKIFEVTPILNHCRLKHCTGLITHHFLQVWLGQTGQTCWQMLLSNALQLSNLRIELTTFWVVVQSHNHWANPAMSSIYSCLSCRCSRAFRRWFTFWYSQAAIYLFFWTDVMKKSRHKWVREQ